MIPLGRRTSRPDAADPPRAVADGHADGAHKAASQRPGLLRRLAKLAGRHWLITTLLAAGLVLRMLTLLAYRPALLYIDSMRYLYNAFPGADPVGYKAPLHAILLVGNLTTVAAVQHLAGLAMAVTLYAVLLRAGTPRWLAAVAAAPVLLDGYQLQIEQTIMPDVWFEVLIVAGLAILLWRPPAGLRAAAAAGVVLGASATVRQVGEILVLPALLYLLVAGGGWRRRLARCAALTAGFAVPVAAYCTGSYLITGHFWLASAGPSDSTYGRMAAAADCRTLRLPADERALCPTVRQQANGPDWLDHDKQSPLKIFRPPPGKSKYQLVASFNRQVVRQQPELVLRAVARDAVKLFALTRTSSQGGTPISRWQFQDGYQLFTGSTSLNRSGYIVIHLRLLSGGGPVTLHRLDPAYAGKPAVIRPLTAFLRRYQLHGGYAPGPLMLLFTLAGLAGSLAVAAGHRTPGRPDAAADPAQASPSRLARRRYQLAPRQLSLACLLFFSSGIAILLASDVFQFSWRYQLPALVTLPPAGALGIAAVCGLAARRSVPAQAA
jgi:hypothetical protein